MTSRSSPSSTRRRWPSSRRSADDVEQATKTMQPYWADWAKERGPVATEALTKIRAALAVECAGGRARRGRSPRAKVRGTHLPAALRRRDLRHARRGRHRRLHPRRAQLLVRDRRRYRRLHAGARHLRQPVGLPGQQLVPSCRIRPSPPLAARPGHLAPALRPPRLGDHPACCSGRWRASRCCPSSPATLRRPGSPRPSGCRAPSCCSASSPSASPWSGRSLHARQAHQRPGRRLMSPELQFAITIVLFLVLLTAGMAVPFAILVPARRLSADAGRLSRAQQPRPGELGQHEQLHPDRGAAVHADGRDPARQRPLRPHLLAASPSSWPACPAACCRPTSSAAPSSPRSAAPASPPPPRSAASRCRNCCAGTTAARWRPGRSPPAARSASCCRRASA